MGLKRAFRLSGSSVRPAYLQASVYYKGGDCVPHKVNDDKSIQAQVAKQNGIYRVLSFEYECEGTGEYRGGAVCTLPQICLLTERSTQAAKLKHTQGSW